jgi:putative YhdH/YhfP family quinone oxidoreductase
MVPTTPFTAFRIESDDAGYRSGLTRLGVDDLNPGQVLIRARWSSVNYKDALAGTGKGRILRRFPLVGGIDVAGTVVASTDPAWREGDAVLATGCGLSETRDGGYSQYVRLESSAVIAQPPGLSPREAMVLGTAGFTAASRASQIASRRPAIAKLVT